MPHYSLPPLIISPKPIIATIFSCNWFSYNKKAPVKLWQVPTEPHARAEAPHTHQTVPARLPLQLHILYNFSLFYTTVYITNKLQHFYSHKKTPYSDHQRIGHRRVFPFFTFLSFIQLQTWYNFIPCERYRKERLL